jgi:serine/threonine protein kinase
MTSEAHAPKRCAPLERFLDRSPPERRLGPFVLVEPLGEGGFAPVWLAREVHGQTELRTAAVKLFALDQRPEGNVRTRERISEEARALCQVEHPSVVRFYALPMDEDACVVGLAMEHVEGTSLATRLRTRGPLTIAEALAAGAALASALAAVHRVGLVHRDVKPANVIDAGGIYKLIDFGISAADGAGSPGAPTIMGTPSDASAAARTATTGALWGTLGYVDPACVATLVAPEAASDLYALGATIFECLTGVLPAASSSGRALTPAILEGTRRAPPLRERRPDVPAALAEIVDALLAPAPRDRPPSAEYVAIRFDQLQHELSGEARALPPEAVGPFRGLGRFQVEDRDVYFGRTSEIAAAVEVLKSRGLVALIGPSGSGKSSLARAGVLPALRRGALGPWPTAWDEALAEPGLDPRAAIVAALGAVVPRAADPRPEDLVDALAERARSTGRGVVLLVDQLEELGTVAAAPSRAWTTELLGRLAERHLPGVRVVVTARRDRLDPLLAKASLGQALIRGSVLVESISELTWEAVIDQALGAYGYRFEDEALRREILAEIRLSAGAMPLVQFALTELWDQRDAGAKVIPRSAFRALGGLSGALDRHAESTLAELGEHLRQAGGAARAILLGLTTAQGTRSSRDRAELERSTGQATAVLEAFERARLLVVEAGVVSLAHEALLAHWERLRAWVAEARESRLLAEEIERDAARWHARPELTATWRGHRLAAGERLPRDVDLSEPAHAFLRASRRAERRGFAARAGAAGSAILALAFAGFGYVRAVRVERDKTEHARVLAEESRIEAERRTREVQEAQGEIDRLLKEMADSPSKEMIVDLQRQIRDARARTPRAESAASTGRPRMAVARTAVAPASAEPPRVEPRPPAVSKLKQETEW